MTHKNGGYVRHPWTLDWRQGVRVQRHLCHDCGHSYSERSALLVRGSWYAREVHRCAIDQSRSDTCGWQHVPLNYGVHVGSSLRRTGEWVRSYVGQQERWWLWRPLEGQGDKRCYLSASTVHRWLDRAGRVAQESVDGQLEGMEFSGHLGTDGLWTRLRGGAKPFAPIPEGRRNDTLTSLAGPMSLSFDAQGNWLSPIEDGVGGRKAAKLHEKTPEMPGHLAPTFFFFNKSLMTNCG